MQAKYSSEKEMRFECIINEFIVWAKLNEKKNVLAARKPHFWEQEQNGTNE